MENGVRDIRQLCVIRLQLFYNANINSKQKGK